MRGRCGTRPGAAGNQNREQDEAVRATHDDEVLSVCRTTGRYCVRARSSPLQVSLSVEQPGAAVDETPADVQERKERNLAGLVGAFCLTLFHFERRHDFLPPRADGLFGLLHPHGGGTDVAHDLRSDRGVLPARPLDVRVGATDSTLVA